MECRALPLVESTHWSGRLGGSGEALTSASTQGYSTVLYSNNIVSMVITDVPKLSYKRKYCSHGQHTLIRSKGVGFL